MKLVDVLAAIDSGLFDADLDTLREMIRSRKDRHGKILAMTAKPGDRVRLAGIRPAGLDGATGTVKARRKTSLMVEIDKEFASRAGRFALSITQGSPLGVPASCIAEIL